MLGGQAAAELHSVISSYRNDEEGAIGTDGTATIRFPDDCREGRDFSTTHRIRVSGHFAAHELSFLPECEVVPDWVRCTSVPQTLGVAGEKPAEACTLP